MLRIFLTLFTIIATAFDKNGWSNAELTPPRHFDAVLITNVISILITECQC